MSSFEDAREQACEKLGYLRSKLITVGNVVWEIPNPSLLDHDQQKRYNALQLFVQESDELDRYKDTKDKDGNVFKGSPKQPWRSKGELVDDDYDVRLVKVLWPDKFDEFIKLGGRPSDIGLYWAEMNQHAVDRAKKDSKSVGGDSRLATVPDSN